MHMKTGDIWLKLNNKKITIVYAYVLLYIQIYIILLKITKQLLRKLGITRDLGSIEGQVLYETYLLLLLTFLLSIGIVHHTSNASVQLINRVFDRL